MDDSLCSVRCSTLLHWNKHNNQLHEFPQSEWQSSAETWWHTVTHGRGSEGGNMQVEWSLALYLGTWCIQHYYHYYRWCAHLGCPVVDWTDAPRQFKWTRPFRWKTKSGICACAITFQTCSTRWHGVHIPQDSFFQNENIPKAKHFLQISEKLRGFVKHPFKIQRKNLTLAISKGFREQQFQLPARDTFTFRLRSMRMLRQGAFWKRQFDGINSVATGHSNTDCNIRTFHCCLYLPSSGSICNYCYLCDVITKRQPHERCPTYTVLSV